MIKVAYIEAAMDEECKEQELSERWYLRDDFFSRIFLNYVSLISKVLSLPGKVVLEIFGLKIRIHVLILSIIRWWIVNLGPCDSVMLSDLKLIGSYSLCIR